MSDPIVPEFDSSEEIYFSWWLDELVEAGYVRSWCRAKSYPLTGAITQPYAKETVYPKTGRITRKVAEKSIKQVMIYTPDFEITWNWIRAMGLFAVSHTTPLMLGPIEHHFISHINENEVFSIVEIKPKVAGVSMTNDGRSRMARMNAMFLYEKHGIYANLVEVGTQPKSLFDRTFTPGRFLTTDKTGKPRTIKFQPRSLSEFVADTKKLKPVLI